MPTFSFARRITRRLRALWHRHELELAMKTYRTHQSRRARRMARCPAERG